MSESDQQPTGQVPPATGVESPPVVESVASSFAGDVQPPMQTTPPPFTSPTVKPTIGSSPPESALKNEPNVQLIDVSPWVRSSPPWLFSAVIHILLLIAFGLWLFSSPKKQLPPVLDAEYSEKLGEQQEEDTLELAVESDFTFDEQILTPDTLPEVEDPLAAPEMTNIDSIPTTSTSDIEAAIIGMALTGRQHGSKTQLLKAYGGTATTEAAVNDALRWLARVQKRKGMWSLRGTYKDGSKTENQEAATAMALLAFQGAGHTHIKHAKNPFTREVDRGWKYLLKQQDENGCFFRANESHHRFYTHAQCSIAICELYGMTRDETLRAPAQLAINYLVKTQSQTGGWRYFPREGSDLSVTGWVMMALQSGRMAGLEVPSDTFDRISKYLDTVSREDGELYAYRRMDSAKRSMTAEGLLCRQYLGWKRDDPRLLGGVDFLLANKPQWKAGRRNVYYWYYATQVCHHMEGEIWQEWNTEMKKTLPTHQVKKGKERGSWTPQPDVPWDRLGGRLFTTCLSTYMLEVYYRHLPIYRRGLLEEL